MPMSTAQTTAVVNQKGGTAKTTTVENLGIGLAREGKKVLLVNTMNRERILKQFLEPFRKEYDYILPDCMPSLGMLTVNELAAADTTIIPVQANYLSAKGLEQLLQTISRVKRQIKPKLKIDGILLTMVDSRTNYAKEISDLIRQTYGQHIKVYETEIPRSVRAAEISSEGKSIYLHDPRGKVADAFQKLTKEVLTNAEKRRKHQLEQLR
jgi:chromosome partitioning protein